MKKKILCLAGFLLISIFAVLSWDQYVTKETAQKCYSSLRQIPSNKVGLVLGTSKFLRKGSINPYFSYRVDAVIRLYKNKKIDYVLISGDNSTESYNEPRYFLQELVKQGIPKDRIFLDFAGFRTLDSVVRAHKVFGQSKFTIISQPFHNQRAVYIARFNGLNAVAYNAQDLPSDRAFKVLLREKFARVKMFLDLYVLGTAPKFLGKPVAITKAANEQP
ncbi:MAG: YdcF family protein [Cytophagales bacterium]|nr:YdcF family protein [Cytophagales bacterium]